MKSSDDRVRTSTKTKYSLSITIKSISPFLSRRFRTINLYPRFRKNFAAHASPRAPSGNSRFRTLAAKRPIHADAFSITDITQV